MWFCININQINISVVYSLIFFILVISSFQTGESKRQRESRRVRRNEEERVREKASRTEMHKVNRIRRMMEYDLGQSKLFSQVSISR